MRTGASAGRNDTVSDAAAAVLPPRPAATARRRANVLVIVALSAAIVAVVLLGVSLGAGGLSPARFVVTLFGQGDSADTFLLFRLRLPAVALGLLAGAAFGVAGALFQSLLRNALASPDIIGISGGASVAAAFSILILGLSGAVVSLAAFGGAAAVALAIYLLAYRHGLSGYRFVLIGVGIAFMAQSVLGYLISRGDVREVSQALVWMVGGVGGASWDDIVVLLVALLVLLPVIALFTPVLRMLQLGDETAAALGVRVERSRPALIALAVALTAVATAFAGPIAFVAFVSAPIARRLVPGGGLALVPSALVGALLVLSADLVGQHLIPGLQVPAGIITGAIGAPYLLWLLATTGRTRNE